MKKLPFIAFTFSLIAAAGIFVLPVGASNDKDWDHDDEVCKEVQSITLSDELKKRIMEGSGLVSINQEEFNTLALWTKENREICDESPFPLIHMVSYTKTEHHKETEEREVKKADPQAAKPILEVYSKTTPKKRTVLSYKKTAKPVLKKPLKKNKVYKKVKLMPVSQPHESFEKVVTTKEYDTTTTVHYVQVVPTAIEKKDTHENIVRAKKEYQSQDHSKSDSHEEEWEEERDESNSECDEETQKEHTSKNEDDRYQNDWHTSKKEV